MPLLYLSKPVLIGLHLGFAIIGIDAFLWLLGEYAAGAKSIARKAWAAALGIVGFLGSWIIGGYYYVVFYGPEVKPIIKAGTAPWAHAIAMEAKEHIFLFLVPLSLTLLFAVFAKGESLRRPVAFLACLTAGIGLLIGAMGFIISAAARWGGFS